MKNSNDTSWDRISELPIYCRQQDTNATIPGVLTCNETYKFGITQTYLDLFQIIRKPTNTGTLNNIINHPGSINSQLLEVQNTKEENEGQFQNLYFNPLKTDTDKTKTQLQPNTELIPCPL